MVEDRDEPTAIRRKDIPEEDEATRSVQPNAAREYSSETPTNIPPPAYSNPRIRTADIPRTEPLSFRSGDIAAALRKPRLGETLPDPDEPRPRDAPPSPPRREVAPPAPPPLSTKTPPPRGSPTQPPPPIPAAALAAATAAEAKSVDPAAGAFRVRTLMLIVGSLLGFGVVTGLVFLLREVYYNADPAKPDLPGIVSERSSPVLEPTPPMIVKAPEPLAATAPALAAAPEEASATGPAEESPASSSAPAAVEPPSPAPEPAKKTITFVASPDEGCPKDVTVAFYQKADKPKKSDKRPKPPERVGRLDSPLTAEYDRGLVLIFYKAGYVDRELAMASYPAGEEVAVCLAKEAPPKPAAKPAAKPVVKTAAKPAAKPTKKEAKPSKKPARKSLFRPGG